MFVVLTYTSDFIVYFVRALRDALSKENTGIGSITAIVLLCMLVVTDSTSK